MMRSTALRVLCLLGVSNWALAEQSEIVFPRVLATRADNNEKQMEITAFGKTMNFRLQPSPVLSPNLVMRTDDGMYFTYTKEKINALNSRLYQDAEQRSSLYIDDTTGPLHVEGMLTEELRIEPVPTLVSRSGEMAHRVSIIAREDDEESPVREIYTKSPFYNDMRFPPANFSVEDIVDYDPEEETSRQLFSFLGGKKKDQSSGDMLVELLVIADKVHSAGFETESEHIRYIAVGANGINLRLASVPDPKTKVVITGILRSTRDETEPYVVQNTNQGVYLYDEKCLNAIGKYIEAAHPTLKYDVAMLYTGKDLVFMENGKLQTNVAGIAWVGAACTKAMRFGLAEDAPKTFNGIRAITHEIAHLLGAPHDGDPAPMNMFGSAGSTACPWKEGFIMSYVQAGEKSHRFSTCSSKQFAFLKQSLRGACLRKTDGQVVTSSNDLPASVYSLQDICARTHSKESGVQYQKDDVRMKKCEFLCCNTQTGRCSIQDAVDGTPCDIGKVCKSKKCD